MRRLTTVYLSFWALTSVNSVSEPVFTIEADRDRRRAMSSHDDHWHGGEACAKPFSPRGIDDYWRSALNQRWPLALWTISGHTRAPAADVALSFDPFFHASSPNLAEPS